MPAATRQSLQRHRFVQQLPPRTGARFQLLLSHASKDDPDLIGAGRITTRWLRRRLDVKEDIAEAAARSSAVV